MAYQLGIVEFKSVSNAIAQRVESAGTPFHDGKALAIRYEQIVLLFGEDFQHWGDPFSRE